ncbi:Uma2 family endonuclease [Schlesneria paludicola]|uniref:Uma2 family endonuclease n=1 Tax=Schlesneria paludicola TaxID=360056 RepID=UPI00029AD500|nr:Uma2 family endonuclease [Schlesneria paludicola]
MSTSENLITLEQYEERLLDGDRWIELAEGRLIRLNPPDDAHGDVVRNLSRALATFLKKSPDTYACFELPLILQREPALVRCPAISCFRFVAGGRFAETDKLLTETRPVLIIEVASTNERREAMSTRVKAYLAWGVEVVWVVDPVTRHVHLFRGGLSGDMLKEPQVLVGFPVLPGFAIPVSDLFRQPDWVKTKPDPFDE